MRARSLKPGFFQNEDLIELPFEYRLLFAGIWTMADREGRLEDRPKKIKLNVFPGDNVDCEAGLVALQRAGFIQRYQIEGDPYVQINAFLKHQSPHPREAPSVIPPPPGAIDKFKHQPVTREQRERILARDGHKCVKCGEIERLHVDHIIAISRGGTSEDSNLRTLCWLCNGQKGAKSVAEHDQGSAKARPRHGLAALTPSSLTPDSGLLTADSSSLCSQDGPAAPARKVEAEPTEFVELRREYPRRAGSQRWGDALKHWRRRIAEGTTPLDILAGVRRYAAFARATNIERTVHVQQAATFLGDNRGYLELWHAPPRAESAMERILRLNGGPDDSRVIDHEPEFRALTGQ